MTEITGTPSSDIITPTVISAGVTGGLPGGGGDTILGLAGDDTLDGGAGANSVLGGAGNDAVFASGSSEVLLGGADLDTLYFRTTDSVSVDLGTNAGAEGYEGSATVAGGITTLFGFERAYGGTGDDIIKGTHGNDTLSGDVGNDTIDGRSGFDMLDYSGSINATVAGGVFVNLAASAQTSGGVTLGGGTARDSWGGIDSLTGLEGVLGTGFADTVVGSNLNNWFDGGAGGDSLNGSGGQDTLAAGSGDDTLRGGDGNDSILAGDGADAILAGAGSDSVDGGERTLRNAIDYRSGNGYFGGALTVEAVDASYVVVTKTDGIDTLLNINQLFGTAGADAVDLAGYAHTAPLSFVVRGGAGNDTITGNGHETVVADYGAATGAVTATLGTGTAVDGSGGTDMLVDVHAIIASNGYDDVLTGSAADDTFIIPGTGNKTVLGGAGTDTWRYQGSAALYIDLGTSSVDGAYHGNAFHSGNTDTLVSIERAYGGLGADTIKGSHGDNTLAGDAGNDSIDGRQGFDVVDYSVWSLTPITAGVSVSLGAGTATDAWGGTDTLANIEGAIGTHLADTLLGSDRADRLTGGAGADSLSGGGSDDTLDGGAGDDILRGGDGSDVIVGGAGFDTAAYLVDSTAATWLRDTAGTWIVTTAEGTDTLTGVEALRFTDRTVVIGQSGTPKDINGDGTSDIAWRGGDGTLTAWTMQGSAGTGLHIGTADAAWSVAGYADFNGDGHADILWRGADGTVAQWQMEGASFIAGDSLAVVDAAWRIAGTGDMNGDGRADILWQHTDGTVSAWLLNGLASAGGGEVGALGADWKVVGMGDFNGDGRSDLVARNDDGRVSVQLLDGAATIGGGDVGNPGTAWTVAGTGDFDGDGRADLLWRNGTDGSVALWTMDGATPTGGGAIASPGTAWEVADVGDYDADGKADILWRNADGSVSLWLMDGTTMVSATALGNPGTDWAIV